jgi:hypothetical protein
MKQRRPKRRKPQPRKRTSTDKPPPLDWLTPLEQPAPIQRAQQHFAAAHLAGNFSLSASAAILTVTRPEEIPAALTQGKPVLIDIPAFQWRASLLATVQAGGKLGWWIFKLLATLLLTQWLNAQFPNTKDYLIPDWAKFNFERQPDNKVILKPPQEE